MNIFGALQWEQSQIMLRQMNVWSAQVGETQTSLFSPSKQALIFSEGWSPHQNLIWKWNLIALLSGSTVPISLWGIISVSISLPHYPSTGWNRCSDLVPPPLIYPTPYPVNHPITSGSDFMLLIPSSTASIKLPMQVQLCSNKFAPLLNLTPTQSHDLCVCVCLKGHLNYQSCSFQGGRHTDWTLFLTVYLICR